MSTIHMTDHHTLAPDLYQMTENLLERALEAKAQGDEQSYQKYLKLAVTKVEDEVGIKPRPQHTAKVISLLENGWNDVDDMTHATGLSSNRIHMILTYLRGKGMSIQAKTIKRYRLVK